MSGSRVIAESIVAKHNSWGLKAQSMGDKGYGLIASKSFKKGAVVATEAAAVWTPLNANGSHVDHCHHCFQWSTALKRCARCKYTRYCGQDHQRDHWMVHRAECNRFSKVCAQTPDGGVVREPPSFAVLVGRVLDNTEISKAVLSLTPIPDDHSKLQELITANLAVCKELFEAEISKGSVDPRDLVQLLLRLPTNVFTMSDWYGNASAVGLFPACAFINHCCSPNTVQVFNGTSISLIAQRDIKQGEEVTICYVDIVDEFCRRQQWLTDGYAFTCDCSRCEKEKNHTSGSLRCPQHGCTGSGIYSPQSVCDKCGSELLGVFRVGQEMLNRAEQFSPDNLDAWMSLLDRGLWSFVEPSPPLAQLVAAAARASIIDGDFTHALTFYLRAAQMFEVLLPFHTPILGMMWLGAAKCSVTLRDAASARENAKRACTVLSGLRLRDAEKEAVSIVEQAEFIINGKGTWD